MPRLFYIIVVCIPMYCFVLVCSGGNLDVHSDEVMGIGQKAYPFVGNVIQQTFQHSENKTEFIIQKTQRGVSVNALGRQKTVHSIIQPGLVLVQEQEGRGTACRMVIAPSYTANFAVLTYSSLFQKRSSDIRRTSFLEWLIN